VPSSPTRASNERPVLVNSAPTLPVDAFAGFGGATSVSVEPLLEAARAGVTRAEFYHGSTNSGQFHISAIGFEALDAAHLDQLLKAFRAAAHLEAGWR
jgi:hypothetical protein